MFGVLVVLFLAAILRVRRGRGAGRVVAERLAEMDDWFNPGRRRQLDQERLVATARIDARTGDGDPLDRFSDAAELRRRRETSDGAGPGLTAGGPDPSAQPTDRDDSRGQPARAVDRELTHPSP
jgi:hypothetical protein